MRTPLFEQLKAYLIQLITENIDKPGYKLPSEASLSKTFDISRITSKKALNDLEEEGLIRRVKGKGSFVSENAKSMILKENSIADSSKNLFITSRVISIIVPDITSLFYIDILNSILNYTTDKDVIVQIANVNVQLENEFSSIRKLAYTSDGLIIFPLDNMNYAKEIIRLSRSRLSIVCIDNYLKNTNIPCIVSDNFEAISQATKNLLEKGHKDIAYLSLDIKNELSLEERYKGFQHAMIESNSPINYSIVRTDLTHTTIFLEHDIENMIRCEKIDAIITSNCGLGIEVARTIISMGKNELLDNLIIFDDEFGRMRDILKFNPKYIRQDAAKIGRTAIDVLMSQMESRGSIQKKIIRIPTEKRY